MIPIPGIINLTSDNDDNLFKTYLINTPNPWKNILSIESDLDYLEF